MTRRPGALAVAVGALVVAAACSGGGSPRTTKASGRTTSTASSTTTPTTGVTTSAAAATTTTSGAAPSSAAPTTVRPSAATAAPPTAPPPTAAPTLSSVRVKLTPIATVDQPTAMAAPQGDDALYVAEKTGRVRVIRQGQVQPGALVDLSGEVSTGSEQGLLGLAFSVDRSKLYVDYTDVNGDTHVTELTVAGGARRDLLFQKQPYANHNGGQLVVRPDGTLWIALGDGGSAGDPQNHAQNLGDWLGKILRIDPRPSGGQPYTVPSDNPFVGRAGARPEIWDFGLRNPWRFSFDRATNDLWIADVGQDAWEEVDLEAPGQGGRNYGWNLMEGTHPYKGRTAPPGAVGPLFDYSHAGGACSITGGFVYRGSRIPALAGAYLYGDYCQGNILAVRQQGGRVVDRASLGMHTPALSSFGEDQVGELYALSLNGAVSRIDPA